MNSSLPLTGEITRLIDLLAIDTAEQVRLRQQLRDHLVRMLFTITLRIIQNLEPFFDVSESFVMSVFAL